ncbi:MAG: DUF4102 domain-containing protein [Deltaproteobacteria bacterium]|nr:MAG: DUF4102 domain-containing protein [Deltaproteobacteria bacterium]
MKFIDRSIQAIKPTDKTFEVWETGYKGFGVRIRPTGRKSWVFLYRFGGKPRRMTLGEYPYITLAEAHVKHAAACQLLKNGVDPGALEQEVKQDQKQTTTIDELIGKFIKHCKAQKDCRGATDFEESLKAEVSPVWGTSRAKDITHRDVVTLHDSINERGATSLGRNALEAIRAMFKFAVETGTVETNPCDGIVDDLIDSFIKSCREYKGNRTYAEYERNLKKDVSPVWGSLKIRDITRRDVIALQDRIIERGAINQSRQVFKIVRRMFNYAVEEAMIDFSPCLGIKPKAKETAKDRFLSEEEIRIFWNSLQGAYMSDPVRRALKLVLVTGQRPGEVAGAHSSEIDGDWWTIPGERTKNKRSHRVFLSPLAKQLFGVGRIGYLLPSPFSEGTDDEEPITPLGMAKALRRSLTGREQYKGKIKEPTIKLPEFTPHDLRRTAATHMGKLGFSGIVGKILNHTDNSVTAIYNQYDFDKEKKRALLAWSRKIEELASGKSAGTVVAFPQTG